LALAIVSTELEQHFARRAGGYFAAMVRKCGSGERTVWALKDKKWGATKPSREGRKVTGNAGGYRRWQ
jgi:hypothetical protein